VISRFGMRDCAVVEIFAIAVAKFARFRQCCIERQRPNLNKIKEWYRSCSSVDRSRTALGGSHA
jgi:hypothetical protein